VRDLAIFLVISAACSDPAVELQIELPANASQWDTSCVTSIEVRAVGQHYPVDPTDFTSAVLQLPSAAPTYADIHDMIRDKVVLDLPKTGLAGVSVTGWSAPANFQQPADSWYPTADLAFFAKEGYIGQDVIELPIVPNVSCAKTPVRVRIVDLFALVAAGSSASCSSVTTLTDNASWSGAGTIVPRWFGSGLEFYGDQSSALAMANLVAFSAPTQVGPDSCFALTGSDDTGTSTGCIARGPSVCAGAGELEIAATNYNAAGAADQTLRKTLPGIIFGSVWTDQATKTPIAGATVGVDPKHAKVFYIDPNASGQFTVRGDQSGTGPSGMFVVYADAIVQATITGGGKTRTLALGATEHSTAGVLVVMQ
jgi:hypothetical protein